MGNRFQLLIFCGPSGSGKTSLINQLFQYHPNKFGFSISHTTRKPRQQEIHGKNYYFTDSSSFHELIKQNGFLEHAIYNQNYYGTSKTAVNDVLSEGKICVLDLDVQGVKQIKNTDYKSLFVFITSPNEQELEKRLIDRNTETHDSLRRRLEAAKREIDYGITPGNFDKVIINDQLEKAYKELEDFIIKKIES